MISLPHMANTRASTVLLVIGFVMATLAAVIFYVGRSDERAKRVWTEEQLQKVASAKEALEQERDELAKAKEALEGQLGDAQTQAKNLADQIAQEKRAREALTTELIQARRESTDLKGRLETERKEKLTLTEDLGKAKQSYQALSNELTTLRQAKEALEKRVKEMLAAQASEVEKIVVKPTADTPPAPTPMLLEGKVMVVNREFNFVVVNLGSKDGLQSGATVSISREGKPIATAQVERIYENMSAATVIDEAKKGSIKEGDLVRVTA